MLAGFDTYPEQTPGASAPPRPLAPRVARSQGGARPQRARAGPGGLYPFGYRMYPIDMSGGRGRGACGGRGHCLNMADGRLPATAFERVQAATIQQVVQERNK
jgi:hypothetical protein